MFAVLFRFAKNIGTIQGSLEELAKYVHDISTETSRCSEGIRLESISLRLRGNKTFRDFKGRSRKTL